jgi:hypothetical protein
MSSVYPPAKEAAVQRAAAHIQRGELREAADIWWRICSDNPYDILARFNFGDLYFDSQQAVFAPGSVDRSRFILRTIGMSYPTPKLTAEYFSNVTQLLQSRPRLEAAGTIVLGTGPGRCGSTSLTGAFVAVEGACSTHENPPHVFWKPYEEQVRFHIERFRLLSQYYSVVFDAAHWWLNLLDRMFEEFPTAKAIGLVRDVQPCVRSFMKIKGSGRGSMNHWVAPGNGIWAASPFDASFPSYAAPQSSLSDPDAAKAAQIERYVREYNAALEQAARQKPDRILLVRTEELSRPETFERIGQFVGVTLPATSEVLNAGGTADSDKHDVLF